MSLDREALSEMTSQNTNGIVSGGTLIFLSITTYGGYS